MPSPIFQNFPVQDGERISYEAITEICSLSITANFYERQFKIQALSSKYFDFW